MDATKEHLWTKEPDWTCPHCRTRNKAIREKCRSCGYDSNAGEFPYCNPHAEPGEVERAPNCPVHRTEIGTATTVWQVCKACGRKFNPKWGNSGDTHRCGPFDWAAHQAEILLKILKIAEAFDLERRGI